MVEGKVLGRRVREPGNSGAQGLEFRAWSLGFRVQSFGHGLEDCQNNQCIAMAELWAHTVAHRVVGLGMNIGVGMITNSTLLLWFLYNRIVITPKTPSPFLVIEAPIFTVQIMTSWLRASQEALGIPIA